MRRIKGMIIRARAVSMKMRNLPPHKEHAPVNLVEIILHSLMMTIMMKAKPLYKLS